MEPNCCFKGKILVNWTPWKKIIIFHYIWMSQQKNNWWSQNTPAFKNNVLPFSSLTEDMFWYILFSCIYLPSICFLCHTIISKAQLKNKLPTFFKMSNSSKIINFTALFSNSGTILSPKVYSYENYPNNILTVIFVTNTKVI